MSLSGYRNLAVALSSSNHLFQARVFSARVFPLLPRRLSRVVVAYELDLTRLGEDWQFQLELPEKAPAVNVDLFEPYLQAAS